MTVFEDALSLALRSAVDHLPLSADALNTIRARCARRGLAARIRSFLTHPRKDPR